MKDTRANSKNPNTTVEWNSKNSAKEGVRSWRLSQYRRFLESDAKTSLYERVKKTCKYKYYYNDQVPNHVAVMRMTTSGINCTDACQLFSKVLEEMGYEVKIEHVRVKCNDGKWYGHYLLNVKGFELKDWVIWDYVSATKTGRPLGVPCCTAGFQHLGWGIVGPVYD